MAFWPTLAVLILVLVMWSAREAQHRKHMAIIIQTQNHLARLKQIETEYKKTHEVVDRLGSGFEDQQP